MATVSSSPPTSPEQTAARPIACLRCPNRRSFCSKDKPKCSRCRDGNFECTYEEARKIAVNETSHRPYTDGCHVEPALKSEIAARKKKTRSKSSMIKFFWDPLPN
ncbi:hypothetical protein B0H63DRAFT_455222 [Podospora didyma]|uniref:Zn(2)-C6 fungal-type domain-containing protein n=1 Tax=Podospora didyma TaxID=330526 RepID=A0AAE0N2L9_9PEZI|nr:hypothetical protein B0H63DRAFT_455222 [Podospora didyma]